MGVLAFEGAVLTDWTGQRGANGGVWGCHRAWASSRHHRMSTVVSIWPLGVAHV